MSSLRYFDEAPVYLEKPATTRTLVAQGGRIDEVSVDYIIPLPSAEVQDQLLDFFAQHFQPWPELRGGPDPDRLFPDEPPNFTAASALIHNFRSFACHPHKVGFRLGVVVGSERYYIRSLVHFIALRWGKRLGGEVGYFRDHEWEPLTIGEAPDETSGDQAWLVVDGLGVQALFRTLNTELRFVHPGDLEKIDAELRRLDQLSAPLLQPR